MDWEWATDTDEWVSPLDMLDEALLALSKDYLPGLDPKTLGQRCVALQQSRQKLDAVIAVGIAEAEQAGVPARAGVRTMAQYLAARTHASPEALRADIRIGTWVSHYPTLEHAMLDGRFSRQHADHVRKLENIRVAHAMARDQHLFIEWATDMEWRSFKHACAYWLKVNDQDGPQPQDEDPKNTVTVRAQPDGRIKGTFNLDPITGGTLIQQLGDEENALFNQDEECQYARTVGQRRAQAFANLLQRGAGRTTTTSKPLIHIVMSLNVLQHAITQMAKDPTEQDFTSILNPDSWDGKCELIDGTPIHPKYALVLMMQARIRRQVLSAKNVTLDASYETRAFPDSMKYIRLVETAGQCVTAGCDAPHTWLHADHRQPRNTNGPTALSNLDPLCKPDNTHKTDGPPLTQRNDDLD